jgi:hypothetical protein
MAEFGLKRLEYRVMYLATVRKKRPPKGSPIHSIRHLFAFMEPNSPKGRDLQRNGLYAIHSLVTDMNGTNGQYTISGRATHVTEPVMRDLAVKGCPYSPKDRYICFEFKLEECITNAYAEGVPNKSVGMP